MELVDKGYEVTYTLVKGLIRSSASGKFEGNDYSSSVRISTVNIYDVENKKTGIIDSVQQPVVFKIVCPDDATAGLVGNAVREKLKKGPITLHGGFPAGDQRIIAVAEPYEYFLFDSKPADKASKGA